MSENQKKTQEYGQNLDMDERDFVYSQINSDTSRQFVTFNVGEEEYGIQILAVQEIVSITDVTHIPNTPEYIRGIINLRGNVIPLLDLRVKFKLEKKDLSKNSVVIVTNIKVDEKNDKIVGIIVDNVSDVLSFSKENLQEVPVFSTNIDTQFIENMGKLDNRMIIILNLTKLLSDEELSHIDKVV